jgi:hypothetical protein
LAAEIGRFQYGFQYRNPGSTMLIPIPECLAPVTLLCYGAFASLAAGRPQTEAGHQQFQAWQYIGPCTASVPDIIQQVYRTAPSALPEQYHYYVLRVCASGARDIANGRSSRLYARLPPGFHQTRESAIADQTDRPKQNLSFSGVQMNVIN